MSNLKDIKITIEPAIPESTQDATGNAIPLLHEIHHALIKLLQSGQESTLDLQSIPLGPNDERQLLATLGRGEVSAELAAIGKSLVWESRIPGIWFIEHYNSDDQLVGKFIEITLFPSILRSQTTDLQWGLEQLSKQLTTINQTIKYSTGDNLCLSAKP